MKKALTIILGAMLMLVVSACNQTAEPVEKDGKTETTKKNKISHWKKFIRRLRKQTRISKALKVILP